MRETIRVASFGLAMLMLVDAVQAVMLETGFYALHNHPAGSGHPPPYGLRLDELYDVTPEPESLPGGGGPGQIRPYGKFDDRRSSPSSLDTFVFDFDYTSFEDESEMFVTLSEFSPSVYLVIIEGQAFGGRKQGPGWAQDAFLGFYQIYFEYRMVIPASADDDLLVDTNVAPADTHFGWIQTPLGDVISLEASGADSQIFRFGDEDDEQGHRGVHGISGWGALEHGLSNPLTENQGSAWLFTAEKSDVPCPASALALGVGAMFVRRRVAFDPRADHASSVV